MSYSPSRKRYRKINYFNNSGSSSSSSNSIVENMKMFLTAENTDEEERGAFINDLEDMADEEVFDVLYDLPINDDQDVDLMFLALMMNKLDEVDFVELIEEVADVDLPIATAWAQLEDSGLLDVNKTKKELEDEGRQSVFEQYEQEWISVSDEESSVSDFKLHPLLDNLQESNEESEKDHSRMGIFSSVWNLLNDVLGASCVAVPFYVLNGGFYPGLIMMIFFSVLSLGTLMVLHHITLKRGVSSFPEMAYLGFGIPGVIISSVFIFLFNWGGTVGNVLLLGQLIEQVVLSFFPEATWFHWRYGIFFGTLLLSPLAYFKSLKRFATISVFCIIAVFFLIFFVIYATLSNEIHWSNLDVNFGTFIKPISLLQAMGGIGYLFTCHDLSFHVVHSLENPTKLRFGIVAGLTMLLTCLIFCALSVCILLSFGYTGIHPNLLDNFIDSKEGFTWVINACRIAMIINIGIGVPYCVYMPRVAVLSIIQLKAPYWVLKFPNNRLKRNVVHIIVTTTILLSAVATGMSGIEMDAIFGLSGGIAGISISIIIPMASWLKVREKDGSEIHFSYCLRLSTGIFFFLLGFFTSITVVYSYL